MKISNTSYYIEATKFFRTSQNAQHTTFSDEGFTYINEALGLAVAFKRTSKSIYTVTIILDGDCKSEAKESIIEGSKFAEQIVLNVQKNKAA